MKTKRKGPRYATHRNGPGYVYERHEGELRPFAYVENTYTAGELVRLLNAGERAKAEVKRLKALLAKHKIEWPPCGNKGCRRCG